MISKDNINYIFDYEPNEGVLIWRIRPSNRVVVGSIAGWKDTDGYVRVTYRKKRYAAHTLIWMLNHGTTPKGVIDHINGIKTDNRIENLRDVTNAENIQNMRAPMKGNKSGYLGVCSEGPRFRALITVNGKQERIGVFDTPEEAHEAYVKRKREVHPTCSI